MRELFGWLPFFKGNTRFFEFQPISFQGEGSVECWHRSHIQEDPTERGWHSGESWFLWVLVEVLSKKFPPAPPKTNILKFKILVYISCLSFSKGGPLFSFQPVILVLFVPKNRSKNDDNAKSDPSNKLQAKVIAVMASPIPTWNKKRCWARFRWHGFQWSFGLNFGCFGYKRFFTFFGCLTQIFGAASPYHETLKRDVLKKIADTNWWHFCKRSTESFATQNNMWMVGSCCAQLPHVFDRLFPTKLPRQLFSPKKSWWPRIATFGTTKQTQIDRVSTKFIMCFWKNSPRKFCTSGITHSNTSGEASS